MGTVSRSKRRILRYFLGQDNFIFKIVLLDRFGCTKFSNLSCSAKRQRHSSRDSNESSRSAPKPKRRVVHDSDESDADSDKDSDDNKDSDDSEKSTQSDSD